MIAYACCQSNVVSATARKSDMQAGFIEYHQGEMHVLVMVQEGGAMRSKCVVNGAHTSLRVVRELANLLVDVNGQNAALSLR